jgi:SP family arabinose:H+ symporter-like MFS transporter
MTSLHSEQGSRIYVFLTAFVAAVGGFLFGFDLNIIAGAQQFVKDYFALDSAQFGWAMSSALLGCLAGPILGAWLCDRIGRRRSLMMACLLIGAGAIGTALPKTIMVFNMFRITGGVGVGLASVASPMYISEISPKSIRGMLVTMNQLAIVVGSLLSIIVSYFLARSLPPTVSWRYMFASMILPVVVFAVLLSRMPETPRWLSERRRFEEARRILFRINGAQEGQSEFDGINAEIEKEADTPRVRLAELFVPGIKTAILLGIVLALMSQWTGWSFTAAYMPTIYRQAGIENKAHAVLLTIFPNVANLLWTLIGIYLVDRVGRRPLYLICALAMTTTMSMVGLVFVLHMSGWPVVAILCLTAGPHAIGFGALSWLVLSEIFPTRIRAKAMSLCTVFLWIGSFVVIYLAPILFDLSYQLFNVPSGIFFLCGFVSLISFFFLLRMLPETKGKSLEQIGASWH